MPTRRSITIKSVKYNFGTARVVSDDLSLKWERSPRVGGKLQLRGNTHERIHGRVPFHKAYDQYGLGYTDAGGGVSNGFYGCLGENQVPTSLSNEVYARFRGKLYKGGASLGVTFGSYKQSRDMILKRYAILSNRAGYWADALTHVGRGRRLEKTIAGLHLEVIFGWTPLLSDIHAATTTLCQLSMPPQFVKAKSSVRDRVYVNRHDGGNIHLIVGAVEYREAWACKVQVQNPNLWLAERAGLLNPAAVVWDLVPWSFVVNMFVNTGQLVNSLTDFSGLTFSDFTRTRFSQIGVNLQVIDRYTGKPRTNATHMRDVKYRDRLAGPPGPRLSYKIPELNASTLSMAASLFTQKFAKISNFINPTKTYRRA